MPHSPLRGVDELINKLNKIAVNTSIVYAPKAINAGLTVLKKACVASVNASKASPRMKRAARTTIGKRIVKARFGKKGVGGKVGFGVGKPTKRQKEKAKKRAAETGRKGVGISASNIHWPTLGTTQRTTKKPKRNTGIMPPILKGVIETAVSTSESDVLNAMQKKVEELIMKDAKKKGK